MICPAAKPPDYGILTLPCVEQYRSTCLVKCKEGYNIKGGNIIDCRVDSEKKNTYWRVPTHCEGMIQKFGYKSMSKHNHLNLTTGAKR